MGNHRFTANFVGSRFGGYYCNGESRAFKDEELRSEPV